MLFHCCSREDSLHAGISSMLFGHISGERSLTTVDVLVNEMSVIQFDVSICEYSLVYKKTYLILHFKKPINELRSNLYKPVAPKHLLRVY